MKLITKQIENKLRKFPLYSQDGKGQDAEVIVKFFNPLGSETWLITEGNKLENGDYEFFGYMGSAWGWSWGYVLLSQLAALGIRCEREIYDSLRCYKVKELVPANAIA